MQAVILAGGKATRLGALTGGLPKPLVPVGDKPFIHYLIAALRRHGFCDIELLVGPFTAAYRAALGDGAALGVRLTLIAEEPPADTAGALSLAAPYLGERFLMLNGDSFLDFNLLDLATRDDGEPWLARLALREVADVGRYGAVRLEGEHVAAFGEKAASGRGLMNGGVYWLKRDILGEIGAPPVSMERDVLPRLAARGLVRAAVYDGRFIDIGTPEDLARAATLLPQWETRPAAFLDRDGVLNRDSGYVHRAADFVWIDGAQQAVKRLNDAGWLVFVVTNQAGIARGLYQPADVETLHRWINEELARTGAHIDAFYFCPHHPEGTAPGYGVVCDCRKPAPGMLLQAMRAWPVRRETSFMIGDKDIDLAAATAAGVRGMLFDAGQNLDAVVAAALAGR
ncbi:MAG TPA: D-glycero-beta-D-manno-heptose 1,7-bisphosphate 7-phosphatase [Stellaceae bacterium]|nr:D-glycero-beta-D-manno-heptose 1,7-bisphosphate 7-phosphatase [Stellaceae bacterium]